MAFKQVAELDRHRGKKDMADSGRRKASDENRGELGDRTLPVSRLHLDLTNPRHEAVDSEAEAIAKLCDSEMIAELVHDIAQRGSLSPLEVLGVVPMDGHPGHFVSLEGNRRTCALIVAADPSRAPDPVRRQLERISARPGLPRQVKAHVFASRKDAKQWIDLRHLGLQGGAGTKEWNTTQKTRAAAGNEKTSARDNTLSVLVLDRLVARGMLTYEQRNQASVSTLTRYLGTPSVRAILGLGSNKELVYTHDADEVDNALLRLVLDSIQPAHDGSFRVNSRTNSTDRLRYANDLKSSGEAPTTQLEHPAPAPSPTKKRAQERAEHKRSARHPDKRKRLIPSDFHIKNKDEVLIRLRHEGLTLDLEDFAFSANYILLALVEQIMTLFAKRRGKWRPAISDQALTQVCAQELKEIGVQGKAVTVVQKAAGNESTPYSLHSLGHVVHGGAITTPKDLKAYFGTWRPALEAMLEELDKKKSRAL